MPLKPIENAVTVTNLASFETGTFPNKHGIIGHTFGSDENSYSEPISGFAKLFEEETIWETAGKSGLQVLRIGSLIVHGNKAQEQQQNVDCVAQGEALDHARKFSLIPDSEVKSTEDTDFEFTRALLNTATDPYSEYLSINNNYKLYTYQIDTLRDNLESYHSLLLDDNENLHDGYLSRLNEGDWQEIIIGQSNAFNIAVRLKLLKWDRQTQEIDLFVRSPFINRGYPRDFVENIERNFGACKGWPSLSNYFAGEIDEQTLLEEIKLEVDYVKDILLYAVKHANYDLILMDYPLLDRYGHIFTLTNLLQKGYSVENRHKYRQHILDAYRRLDNDLEEISRLARKKNYDIIIASGHGFFPIHTSININRLLEVQGFSVLLSQNEDWEIKAFPGKVSAHVYLNKKIAGTGAQDSLRNRAKHLFENLRDPKNQEIAVDKVYTNEDLGSIGLNHRNSGDLWVLLKPGYVFQPQVISERPIFDSPLFLGDHGYSSRYPESIGVIIYENLPKETKTNTLEVVDIVPTVAHLLHMQLVAKVDGRNILEK